MGFYLLSFMFQGLQWLFDLLLGWTGLGFVFAVPFNIIQFLFLKMRQSKKRLSSNFLMGAGLLWIFSTLLQSVPLLNVFPFGILALFGTRALEKAEEKKQAAAKSVPVPVTA